MERLIMRYSKSTTNFAYDIVQSYAAFDKDNHCYEIDIDSIADFDLNKLAAHIYLDNPDFEAESTGADNICYEKHMLPALNLYLRNSTDNDVRKDFAEIWASCTTKHAMNVIRELLNDALIEYNQTHDEAA